MRIDSAQADGPSRRKNSNRNLFRVYSSDTFKLKTGVVANFPAHSILPQMMSFVSAVLPYVQIILSVVLIGVILLQRSESGLGSGFGSDGFSTGHQERRGLEKTLFYLTIIVACLFVISAFINLIIVR